VERVVIRNWKYPSRHVFAFWNGAITTPTKIIQMYKISTAFLKSIMYLPIKSFHPVAKSSRKDVQEMQGRHMPNVYVM